jgi:hypothetical protein
MPLDAKDFAVRDNKGGIRGGLGLFKWEDVAKDKDKTHYLGNTIRSSTGMWAKRKDIFWFEGEKSAVKGVELEELAQVKRREAEAMAEALGVFTSQPLGDQVIAQALIKKDMEERAFLGGHKIVGLGLEGFLFFLVKKSFTLGAAKREVVRERKRMLKSEKKKYRSSSRDHRSPRDKKTRQDDQDTYDKRRKDRAAYERDEKPSDDRRHDDVRDEERTRYRSDARDDERRYRRSDAQVDERRYRSPERRYKSPERRSDERRSDSQKYRDRPDRRDRD